jgi:hypothetical protein
MIKTDAEGNENWNRTFGGSGRDYARSVQQTSDGGYVLAGWAKSRLHDDLCDWWLLKVDADGNIVRLPSR